MQSNTYICAVSLLFSAFYAKCPSHVLLYTRTTVGRAGPTCACARRPSHLAASCIIHASSAQSVTATRFSQFLDLFCFQGSPHTYFQGSPNSVRHCLAKLPALQARTCENRVAVQMFSVLLPDRQKNRHYLRRDGSCQPICTLGTCI